MSILIRQARIIFPGNTWHNKVADLLIEGGKLSEVKKNIPVKNNAKVIEADGLCVSPGWIDFQAALNDPGLEHKEDLTSLLEAAASGGFTGICVHSATVPALHSKSQIEYVLNKTRNKIVDVYPVGTLSMDAKGKDLSEMFDMKSSGALAFSDHKHAIKDSGFLMRALQYAKNIDSLVIAHCNDTNISHGGQMNEGEVSVGLGLKGIPALAEELMLERNLSILEYTGGKLHVPTVSTKRSAELIRKAKSAGLNVTAGVAVANLLLDETHLKEFDSNLKIDPPLRTKKDVQALRNAVENGVIDVIVSDHTPQDVESKELEFDLAENGMISLQTTFSCALEALKEESIDAIVNALAIQPRKILGLSDASLEEGSSANLTLFSLKSTTALTQKNNASRSANSPFFGKEMKGKVIGIINGAKIQLN